MSSMSQICDELRQAIMKGKKSRYRLWKETGIEQAALSRFMSGKTGLNIETLEQLAPALGFELVLRKKKRKRKEVQ
ncbi:MAG: helix-turn-helix transcriptional regulator [Phycisphaerales bacterium]|nr:MAG: helix-turn-helix transcriptional regulator [Phycisphaerales bacterium]